MWTPLVSIVKRGVSEQNKECALKRACVLKEVTVHLLPSKGNDQGNEEGR
jgi:hypothetical protein